MANNTDGATSGCHSRRLVLRSLGGGLASGVLGGCLSGPSGTTPSEPTSDNPPRSLSNPPSVSWKRWYDPAADGATPSPEPDVTIVAAVTTPDGGYALAGHVLPPDAGNRPLLLKTDANGREQWRRQFVGGPTRARGLCRTADGGFLLVGEFTHPDGSASGGGAIKTDTAGQVQWRAFPAPDARSAVWDAVRTGDGTYALAGWVEQADEYRGWVAILDPTGDTVITRTVDTADDAAERVNDYTVAELFTAITTTDDGGVVLAGKNADGGRVQKVATSGTTVWTTQFDFPRDVAYDILGTEDGGFVVTGRLFDRWNQPEQRDTAEMFPTALYLTRLDASGTEQWTRAYRTERNESGHTVEPTADNGYLLAGGSVGMSTGADVFMVKTDQDGKTMWRRTYLQDTVGTVGHDLVEAPDGSYALAARTVFVKF